MQGSAPLNPEYLELFSKLKSEVLTASINDFAPHVEKKLVYELKVPNDLAEMGLHMALNKVSIVRAFKEAGELFPITKEQFKSYQENECQFRFLIIQPFVLIQKA